MHIYGVPEHTIGTVDDKVLHLVNSHLKVSPPLVFEDIEVAHRLCKPPPKPQVSDPPDAPEPDEDNSEHSPSPPVQPTTPP